MNFSLGIYDVFATAVPGSLYLVATIYLAIRFGWIDWADLAGLDTTFAIVGGVVASFVLGQVLGSSLRGLVELVPVWRPSVQDLREEFCRRNPTLAARPFLDANPFTLLAGLRQLSPEAATEVDRSRAAGVMLRSSSPAFLIGGLIALVEAVVDTQLVAVPIAIGLLVLAALALHEGHRRSGWAWMHTYECATWMPEVDARIAPPPDQPE